MRDSGCILVQFANEVAGVVGRICPVHDGSFDLGPISSPSECVLESTLCVVRLAIEGSRMCGRPRAAGRAVMRCNADAGSRDSSKHDEGHTDSVDGGYFAAKTYLS